MIIMDESSDDEPTTSATLTIIPTTMLPPTTPDPVSTITTTTDAHTALTLLKSSWAQTPTQDQVTMCQNMLNMLGLYDSNPACNTLTDDPGGRLHHADFMQTVIDFIHKITSNDLPDIYWWYFQLLKQNPPVDKLHKMIDAELRELLVALGKALSELKTILGVTTLASIIYNWFRLKRKRKAHPNSSSSDARQSPFPPRPPPPPPPDNPPSPTPSTPHPATPSSTPSSQPPNTHSNHNNQQKTNNNTNSRRHVHGSPNLLLSLLLMASTPCVLTTGSPPPSPTTPVSVAPFTGEGSDYLRLHALWRELFHELLPQVPYALLPPPTMAGATAWIEDATASTSWEEWEREGMDTGEVTWWTGNALIEEVSTLNGLASHIGTTIIAITQAQGSNTALAFMLTNWLVAETDPEETDEQPSSSTSTIPTDDAFLCQETLTPGNQYEDSDADVEEVEVTEEFSESDTEEYSSSRTRNPMLCRNSYTARCLMRTAGTCPECNSKIHLCRRCGDSGQHYCTSDTTGSSSAAAPKSKQTVTASKAYTNLPSKAPTPMPTPSPTTTSAAPTPLPNNTPTPAQAAPPPKPPSTPPADTTHTITTTTTWAELTNRNQQYFSTHGPPSPTNAVYDGDSTDDDDTPKLADPQGSVEYVLGCMDYAIYVVESLPARLLPDIADIKNTPDGVHDWIHQILNHRQQHQQPSSHYLRIRHLLDNLVGSDLLKLFIPFLITWLTRRRLLNTPCNDGSTNPRKPSTDSDDEEELNGPPPPPSPETSTSKRKQKMPTQLNDQHNAGRQSSSGSNRYNHLVVAFTLILRIPIAIAAGAETESSAAQRRSGMAIEAALLSANCDRDAARLAVNNALQLDQSKCNLVQQAISQSTNMAEEADEIVHQILALQNAWSLATAHDNWWENTEWSHLTNLAQQAEKASQKAATFTQAAWTWSTIAAQHSLADMVEEPIYTQSPTSIDTEADPSFPLLFASSLPSLSRQDTDKHAGTWQMINRDNRKRGRESNLGSGSGTEQPKCTTLSPWRKQSPPVTPGSPTWSDNAATVSPGRTQPYEPQSTPPLPPESPPFSPESPESPPFSPESPPPFVGMDLGASTDSAQSSSRESPPFSPEVLPDSPSSSFALPDNTPLNDLDNLGKGTYAIDLRSIINGNTILNQIQPNLGSNFLIAHAIYLIDQGFIQNPPGNEGTNDNGPIGTLVTIWIQEWIDLSANNHHSINSPETHFLTTILSIIREGLLEELATAIIIWLLRRRNRQDKSNATSANQGHPRRGPDQDHPDEGNNQGGPSNNSGQQYPQPPPAQHNNNKGKQRDHTYYQTQGRNNIRIRNFVTFFTLFSTCQASPIDTAISFIQPINSTHLPPSSPPTYSIASPTSPWSTLPTPDPKDSPQSPFIPTTSFKSTIPRPKVFSDKPLPSPFLILLMTTLALLTLQFIWTPSGGNKTTSMHGTKHEDPPSCPAKGRAAWLNRDIFRHLSRAYAAMGTLGFRLKLHTKHQRGKTTINNNTTAARFNLNNPKKTAAHSASEDNSENSSQQTTRLGEQTSLQPLLNPFPHTCGKLQLRALQCSTPSPHLAVVSHLSQGHQPPLPIQHNQAPPRSIRPHPRLVPYRKPPHTRRTDSIYMRMSNRVRCTSSAETCIRGRRQMYQIANTVTNTECAARAQLKHALEVGANCTPRTNTTTNNTRSAVRANSGTVHTHPLTGAWDYERCSLVLQIITKKIYINSTPSHINPRNRNSPESQENKSKNHHTLNLRGGGSMDGRSSEDDTQGPPTPQNHYPLPNPPVPMWEHPVDEATRIDRAKHLFGVLNHQPEIGCFSNCQLMHLDRERVQALARMDSQHAANLIAWDRYSKAAEKLEYAYKTLSCTDTRKKLFIQATDQARPTIFQCTEFIDVATLELYAKTKEGADYAGQIHRFLSNVQTRHGSCTNNSWGTITVLYRNCRFGWASIATGWILQARAYAIGASAFKLHPKRLRAVALDRFTEDADDRSSHPEVHLHANPTDRQLMRYIHGDHREHWLAILGARLLPGANATLCRDTAKELLNALENQGSYDGWAYKLKSKKGTIVTPLTRLNAIIHPPNNHPPGTSHTPQPFQGTEPDFDLHRVIAAQQRRAKWMIHRHQGQYEFTKQYFIMTGNKQGKPDRTFINFFMQQGEGISRDAKCLWASQRGIAVCTLEHDGIRIATGIYTTSGSLNISKTQIRAELQSYSSHALGYEQEVTFKTSDWPVSIFPRPCLEAIPTITTTPNHPTFRTHPPNTHPQTRTNTPTRITTTTIQNTMNTHNPPPNTQSTTRIILSDLNPQSTPNNKREQAPTDTAPSERSFYDSILINTRGLIAPQGRHKADDLMPSRQKLKYIMNLVERRKPAIIFLNELAGDGQDIQYLKKWFQKELKMDSEATAGKYVKEGSTYADSSGGVLLAWRQDEFKTQKNGKGRRAFTLFTAAALDTALPSNAEPNIKNQIKAFAGRRALAVTLIRRKGPTTGELTTFVSTYLPADKGIEVRKILVKALTNGLRDIQTPWHMAGDLNLSLGTEFRANPRANNDAENCLRGRLMGTSAVGYVVPCRMDGTRGYSHQDRQSNATLDYHVVSASLANRVSSPPVLDEHLPPSNKGGDYLLDHIPLITRTDEGPLDRLGVIRGTALRTPKQHTPWFRREANHIHSSDNTEAKHALGGLETDLAQLEKERRQQATKNLGDTPIYNKTSGDPHEAATYWRKMCKLLDKLNDDNRRFLALDNTGIYESDALSRVRDKTLFAGNMNSQAIAIAVKKEARERHARAATRSTEAKRKTRSNISMGHSDPSDPAIFQAHLQAVQNHIKAANSTNSGKLSAVRLASGAISCDAEEASDELWRYGSTQNAESTCIRGAALALANHVIPTWNTLTMPDGSAWSLRKVITYAFFEDVVFSYIKQKAPSLHPFLTDHLTILGRGHPILKRYHELLLRCFETGTCPDHWKEIIAILIPKTYGDALAPKDLRDIWLVAHGQKLANKLLLRGATSSLADRYLACAAGFTRGRGIAELAFAMHATIALSLKQRQNTYVLYVDLSKCFMSFDRVIGLHIMRMIGLPDEAAGAWWGMYSEGIQGCFETAFGSSKWFKISRGFIQGAIESPEFCKCLINTMAEWVGLKVTGIRLYHPEGAAQAITQLIFADDAAGLTGEFEMTQRLARFWGLWAWIFGMKVNIAGFKKTVWSGAVHVKNTKGEWFVRDAFNGKGKLKIGDQIVPQMAINRPYVYVGMHTCMDGSHAKHQQKALLAKYNNHRDRTASLLTGRREAIAVQNSSTNGLGGFYGGTFGASLDALERIFGPLSRRCISDGRLKKGKRLQHAPRLLAHALRVSRPDPPVNDTGRARLWESFKQICTLTGLGLTHMGPTLLASGAATFWNCMAMPTRSPGNIAAHASYAQLLAEFGNCDDPADWSPGDLLEFLDQNDIIERAVHNITCARGGRMDYRRHDDTDNNDDPLNPKFWPGWPNDSILLWKGPFLQNWNQSFKQKQDARKLMRAGILEIAALGNTKGTEFETRWDIVSSRFTFLEGTPGTQESYNRLITQITKMDIQPQPFRRPPLWPTCIHPKSTGNPFLDAARDLEPRAAAAAEKDRIRRSGDGGLALEELLKSCANNTDSEETFNPAIAACMGESIPRAAIPEASMATPVLTNAAGTRRIMHWYKSQDSPHIREWEVRQHGGQANPEQVKPREAAIWVDTQLLIWGFNEEGWISGEPNDLPTPNCVIFWQHCENIVKEKGGSTKLDNKECYFILKRLLIIESTEPNIVFVASDGTRKPPDDINPAKCGRAHISHDGTTGRSHGGALDTDHEEFESHSYDTELIAFTDALWALPAKSNIAIITDCLSGVWATGAFRLRTANKKASRFRDDLLEQVNEAEDRHNAVHYVWVHSHQGITPNEAADIEADRFIDTDSPPRKHIRKFHTLSLPGCKRSIGQLVYEYNVLLLLTGLSDTSHHTLRANGKTWTPFRNVVKHSPLTNFQANSLADLQTDRASLFHEGSRKTLNNNCFDAHLARQDKLPDFTRARCCCGAYTQDRWHLLTACCGTAKSFEAKRNQATTWLQNNAHRINTPDCEAALDALTGATLSDQGKLLATRFLAGLPTTPDAEQKGGSFSPALAAGLACSIHGFISDLLDHVRTQNSRSLHGDDGISWHRFQLASSRKQTGQRSTWWGSCGRLEQWRTARTARVFIQELKKGLVAAGPARKNRINRPPQSNTQNPTPNQHTNKDTNTPLTNDPPPTNLARKLFHDNTETEPPDTHHKTSSALTFEFDYPLSASDNELVIFPENTFSYTQTDAHTNIPTDNNQQHTQDINQDPAHTTKHNTNNSDTATLTTLPLHPRHKEKPATWPPFDDYTSKTIPCTVCHGAEGRQTKQKPREMVCDLCYEDYLSFRTSEIQACGFFDDYDEAVERRTTPGPVPLNQPPHHADDMEVSQVLQNHEGTPEHRAVHTASAQITSGNATETNPSQIPPRTPYSPPPSPPHDENMGISQMSPPPSPKPETTPNSLQTPSPPHQFLKPIHLLHQTDRTLIPPQL